MVSAVAWSVLEGAGAPMVRQVEDFLRRNSAVLVEVTAVGGVSLFVWVRMVCGEGAVEGRAVIRTCEGIVVVICSIGCVVVPAQRVVFGDCEALWRGILSFPLL